MARTDLSPIEGGGLFGTRETFFARALRMRSAVSLLHIVSTDGIITTFIRHVSFSSLASLALRTSRTQGHSIRRAIPIYRTYLENSPVILWIIPSMVPRPPAKKRKNLFTKRTCHCWKDRVKVKRIDRYRNATTLSEEHEYFACSPLPIDHVLGLHHAHLAYSNGKRRTLTMALVASRTSSPPKRKCASHGRRCRRPGRVSR